MFMNLVLYILLNWAFFVSNIHNLSSSLNLNFFAQKSKTGSFEMRCPVRPYVLLLQGASHSRWLDWESFMSFSGTMYFTLQMNQ